MLFVLGVGQRFHVVFNDSRFAAPVVVTFFAERQRDQRTVIRRPQ